MPDAARIAQALPLEVPIILQGAKPADENGNRELFKETATTTLVFDNGAVLNLKSKLAVGQTVFIHNTLNGREVLCKVLEAPPDGEAGFTDLEFTNTVANFWQADAEQSDASRQAAAAAPDAEDEPAAKVHVPSGEPNDDPLAMMLETASKIDVPSMTNPSKESGVPLHEDLVPAHQVVPSAVVERFPDPTAESFGVASPEASASSQTEPTGEQIDAALRQMSGAPPGTPLTGGAEASDGNEEKHLAALMARDARLAKFAAFKERQQAEKTQRETTPKDGAKHGAKHATQDAAGDAAGAADGGEQEFAATKPKVPISELLTTGKNATYVAIAAGALFTVAVVFIWHAMRAPLVQPTDPTVVASPDQPTVASSAAAAVVDAVRSIEPASPPSAPSEAEPRPTAEVRPARPRGRTPAEAGNFYVPAKVLSQPQPTLPPWAVGVEVDGVVTLDVTIGDDGSVVDARVISGPRPLQREAQRAVGLWEFEPARANGKPIESHMTLNVQFLAPPVRPKYPYPQ